MAEPTAAPTPSLGDGALATPVAAPFGRVLVEIGERREDVVVLAADLARYVEVESFAKQFPKRFLQMGMSEQNMIGVASGLAKEGLHPIVVTYGVFISRRAFDQVAMALATGPTPAVLVGFMPGITTPFRATHQAIDDVALLRALPGMTVIDPADDLELGEALRASVEEPGPVYLRAYRGAQPPLPIAERSDFSLGAAVQISDGDGAAFLSTGLGTQWALEAAALLADQGIEPAILHVPTLKPLDGEAIRSFCELHQRVVCVENHTVVGGLHAAAAAVLAEAGTPTRLVPAGVPDRWPPAGSVPYIRSEFGLDAEALARLALQGGGAR